jgi:hypothetical protein
MNGQFEQHPSVGGWKPGPGWQGYQHPMWGAAVGGVGAILAAENAQEIMQAQQQAQIALLAAASAQSAQSAPIVPLKSAISAHLASAQQILLDPAPTVQTTAAAGVHVNAASILLAQTG